MLSCRGLVKTYGGRRALDGFDLTVEPGEIVGLIGHNGAGKTTFAEIAAGLVRPDAGRITVDGVDVVAHPARAKAAIGLSPQELALYPRLTVREHVRLFGRLAGLRGRRLDREVDAVLEAMLLTDLAGARSSELSGGQRRRLQTATALTHRPPVLLLDEPTVGADPVTREALLAAVEERAAEGAAVCYTTHYLPELERLGAEVAIAEHGRVVARDSARRLLADLPSELTVRFTDAVPVGLREWPGAVVDDAELRLSTAEPARDLAGMLGGVESSELAGVEVRPPNLDDLYHRMADRTATTTGGTHA